MPDLGQWFVRTKPLNGDYSYLPTYGVPEEQIWNSALMLVEIKDDNIIFRHNLLPENISLSKKWDDGNWVTVKQCVQLFKKKVPLMPINIIHKN